MESARLPAPQERYDTAPCGLLLAEADGTLLDANATFCRWLGYRREELLAGMRLQDLLTMGGRIFHQTHLAPLLRMQGSVAEVKLELRGKGGKALPMMLNLAERAWEGRTLLQVAAFVAEDRYKYEHELLLQRRRAEELAAQHAKDQHDLAAARGQAEDRALFAEQMVGIVSHDLRNPLSAIQMSAVLLEMSGLPDKQQQVAQRITRSVRRAERLIAELLDFTQARLGGQLAVRPGPADVHELVAEGLAELRLAFAQREIVHERIGPGGCQADADRITQAVGNLVGNAVNYGDPQRPVTVTTQGQPGWLHLSVHNHGAPIAPPLLERLFEPMVRGSKATGSRGVGLGLYIVRAIAQAHGGEVDVRSTPQDGTRFTIRLPCGAP